MLGRIILFALAAGGLSIFELSAQSPVFTCDFSDLTPGPLDGQNGWSQYATGTSDRQGVSPVVGTSEHEPKVWVGQAGASEKVISRARQKVSLGLEQAGRFVLEFDVCHEGEAKFSVAMMGIGNATGKNFSGPPPMLGVQFGTFAIRDVVSTTEAHTAYGADGKPMKAVVGDWYRVRSEWSFDEGTGEWYATLAIKNLTKNDPDFVPLWFDRKNSQASVALGLKDAPQPEYFNHLSLRVGSPHGKVAQFKIYLPEP